MPARFPTWSNAAVRWSIVGVALTIIAVPLALMGWVRSPYMTGLHHAPEQPVPFDHRHHVVDDGIDCEYCHMDAERSPYAGIPSSDLCMNCHDQIRNQSPVLQPVRDSYLENRPLVWTRVYALPDFVYFDHEAHVRNGVGCETCHGRVDRMARVAQEAPLSMRWCLRCHRDPGPNLRPLDRITTMGWKPPADRDPREYADSLVHAYGVRSLTNCTTCHR